jgi:hypothetical protein
MRYWMLLALAAGCGQLGQTPGSPEPPAEPAQASADGPDDQRSIFGPRSLREAQDKDRKHLGRRAPRRGPDLPRDPDAEPAPDPVLAAPRKPSRRPAAVPGDAQAFLDAHNRYRARHCAAPLTWSPKLAQVAQSWASSLRDKGCAFGHSGGTFGENLAAGTTGTLDPETVVKMWYDEISRYRFPGGGFSAKTGHFTQVVWRGTSRIGCGRSQCKGMDIFVCEYDPAGNWEGRYRDNVLPLGCR